MILVGIEVGDDGFIEFQRLERDESAIEVALEPQAVLGDGELCMPHRPHQPDHQHNASHEHKADDSEEPQRLARGGDHGKDGGGAHSMSLSGFLDDSKQRKNPAVSRSAGFLTGSRNELGSSFYGLAVRTQDLREDVGEDAAGAVVVDFDGGVDADDERDVEGRAVGFVDAEGGFAHGLEVVGQAQEVEGGIGEVLDLVVVGLVLEVAGQDAHADEVAAVDALEGLRDDGLHAEQTCAFRGPVAAGAHAVVFTTEDDARCASGFVGLGGVVDAHFGACGLQQGVAAFFAAEHEVLDAHVGEGAAGHDEVIAATAAVAVEIGLRDAVVGEEAAGGAGFLDGSGRADVVGGDAVAEDAERAGTFDFHDVAGGHAEVGEEGRMLDVGGFAVPLEDLADATLDLVPLRILRGEVGVELAEDIGRKRGLHGIAHFFERGPDVLQIDAAAGDKLVLAQINIDGASDGVGDDERGRHEEVRLDALMHAGLEVAVPGEHGGGDDVLAFDDIFNASVERAGVANAGGAAVADGLEAELVELDLEAGLVEVIGHDAAAWAEAGFDGRLHGEALRVRFLGEQTGGEHDARIGGIRAACDGGDEHGAIGDGVFRVGFAVHDDFGGLEGLRFAETTGLHIRAEQVAELRFQCRHFDAVLRTLRTGHAGHHAAEVDLHLGGEFDAALLGGDAPHALRFVVGLDGLAKFLAAAGAAQVGDGFFVHAEEAHRRAILRCHVGDGRTIGDRQADRAGAVEFDEFADDAELAQLLRHFEHEVGGGDALFERSGEINAHHFRHEEGHRLAEHARFGFNATHAPTHDAEAVDHRRVRIGADE